MRPCSQKKNVGFGTLLSLTFGILPCWSQFGSLIFNEDFNTLDLSVWKHELTLSGGGNWEFEWYTNNRSNSWVRDSVLYLKTTLTNDYLGGDTNSIFYSNLNIWGGNPADVCTSNAFYGCQRQGSASNPINPIQSARLRTADSFRFRYGRVQIRAQMPEGDWLWPAVWLLPRFESYGQWPASGEIDLIEARSNAKLTTDDGQSIGISEMGSTLHWGPYWSADQWPLTTAASRTSDNSLLSDDFHTWTMDWTPKGFEFTMDGQMYLNVSTDDSGGYWNKGDFDTKYPGTDNPWKYGASDAPFDQEFYLIVNLACGGVSGYFPDGSMSSPNVNGVSSYAKPWSDSSSTAALDFWNARQDWYPTWKAEENNGESAALKIDSIKVYQYTGPV